MRLLIDGYNLLHASDLFGAGELAGTLRGSREALLDFLAARLPAKLRGVTVVVFDAADAPPGLPDRVNHAGLDVRYARGFADADAMIESLLEPLNRARGLTVVSGDRRVQRAARSSGARWVDSDAWLAALRRQPPEETASGRPVIGTGSDEDWVAEFSDPERLEEIARQAEAAPPPVEPPRQPGPSPAPPTPSPAPQKKALTPKPLKRRKKRRPPLDEPTDKPLGGFGSGVFDPFPPGYADDLDPPEAGPDDPGAV